jgi:V/A-type H+-transporting ATPase subunit I
MARPIRHGEEDEVPVVLANPAFLRPFERLLALMPTPRYGTTDPTPWLALFFPLFFGFILADVGFGVIALAVALAIRLRGRGGAAERDLAAVALACAASATVFGVLFGEAFGELGACVGLHPILLDRRRAYMVFLWIALGLGAVHVLLGMALGIADAARARHSREIAARSLRLAVILVAGATGAAAAGILPPPILRWTLALLGVLVAASVAAGGFLAPLDAVLGLGNVLSYARLMALGLASAMLAEVANRMAGSVRPAAIGLAFAILLHAINFTIGLISPVIASLRLHYVEFFEKFYEGGGRPYHPLALGT